MTKSVIWLEIYEQQQKTSYGIKMVKCVTKIEQIGHSWRTFQVDIQQIYSTHSDTVESMQATRI